MGAQVSDEHKQILREWHKSHGTDGMYIRDEDGGSSITVAGKKVLAELEQYPSDVVAGAIFLVQARKSSVDIWDVVRHLRATQGHRSDVPEWLEMLSGGEVVESVQKWGKARALVVKLPSGEYELWGPVRTSFGSEYWCLHPPRTYLDGWAHLSTVQTMEQKQKWRDETLAGKYDGGIPMRYIAAALRMSDDEIEKALEQPQARRPKPKAPDPVKVLGGAIVSVAEALAPGKKWTPPPPPAADDPIPY